MSLGNEISLGWVDFSNDASVSVFFKNKKSVESRDPLNISGITKYYAEEFFPGIVTQITRAKYYVAVPYALLELEEMVKAYPEKYPSVNEIKSSLEDIEKRQRDALCKNSKKGESFPGNLNKGGSFNFPSDDYWASLQKFGIRKVDCNKNIYLRNLKETTKTPEERWDIIPLYNLYKQSGIKAGKESIDLLKIDLTKEERKYLSRKFKAKDSNSPFAKILEIAETSEEVKNYIISKFNANGKTNAFRSFKEIYTERFDVDKYTEDFNVALSFSNFMYVLNIIYKLKILENKSKAEKLWNDIDMTGLITIAENLDVDKLPLKKDNMTNIFLTDAKRIMLEKGSTKESIQTELDELVSGYIRKDIKHNISKDDEWKGQVKPDFYSGTAAKILLDLIGG